MLWESLLAMTRGQARVITRTNSPIMCLQPIGPFAALPIITLVKIELCNFRLHLSSNVTAGKLKVKGERERTARRNITFWLSQYIQPVGCGTFLFENFPLIIFSMFDYRNDLK